MAEFSKVSRGYIRMCESFVKTCEGCPISAHSGNDIYVCRNRLLKNPEKYEDTIIKWAEEHPEPVYPTWWSWLINEGVIEKGSTYAEAFNQLKMKPIHADIAQKLSIEPKNG